ncbi:hypothetical protein HYPBUDRAFT_152089 [Hyphopichia burtonii NRRL Y-1933]|uniref:Uncharacterized protein n=1 Tax=Hyphopichia burtonii NRRL Y-1933 TaxID=984485 RepID=A0A1E4RNB6_9ASCO|nr:hypothetical protein HYPBUDRAFT_152089 [Hyphopichia burtonii NRRL Y-1933]ODV68760.1 hypothetical protein HYPBUDRAFT_152089 [Hyphopichia burtonii NRRL Y-1933]
MVYSTGRGGAGNIQNDPSLTSHENHITPVKSPGNPIAPQVSNQQQKEGDDKKFYYSTGRGGAGNIHSSSSIPSPKLVPQGSNTPQLHTKNVSTGRGGYGNMLKNDNPELTRKLQDVDGPPSVAKENELYAVASNKSFSIGRGGFGNVISQTKSNSSKQSNKSQDQPVNLMAISSHGDQDKSKKKGFLGKIKEYFS